MKFTVGVCAIAAGFVCMALWFLPHQGFQRVFLMRRASTQIRRVPQSVPDLRFVAVDSQNLTFEPQSASLPDNAHLELQAVTWGNRHRFQNVEYDVPPVLPNEQQPADVNALVLWIKGWRDPSGPNARNCIQPGTVRIYDEAGQEAVVCESMTTIKYLPFNSHLICLRAFPRRSREINLEVIYDCYDRRPSTQLHRAGMQLHQVSVRFHVPNPRVIASSGLTAESLPRSKQEGELEATLECLRPVPAPMEWFGSIERMEAQAHMQHLDTLAAFHYRYAGQPDPNWTPAESVLWDSTGNCYSGRARTLYPNNVDDGTGRGMFKGVQFYQADNGEPLKLGVWFYRAAEADFTPEEQATIANVSCARTARPDYTAAQARWNGATLQVQEIGECQCAGKRTSLEVDTQGLPPHTQLLLQARDERGNRAQGVVGPTPHSKWIPGLVMQNKTFLNGRSVMDASRQRIEFLMDLPPGATTLTLTFAINQSHYIEFTPPSTVKPIAPVIALH